MMKLNEKISTIKGNILMRQPQPQVAQAFRIFAQGERHKEVAQHSVSIESLAFAANKSRGYSQQGYGNSSSSNFSFQNNFSYKSISENKRPSSN